METILYDKDGATLLSPDELVGLKFKHITTRAELNHLEQANIEAGLLWLRNKKHIDFFTEKFLKDLHKKLFGEVWNWAGNFRLTEKNIGIDPLKIGVQLKILLDDVQFWINKIIYNPLEIAARFHHRLVYIHLFPNGNGRHARIATDTLLKRIFKLPAIDWAGGFDLTNMNKRREDYVKSLRAADKGNFDLLFDFINVP